MALKVLLADDSMIAQNMGKKILTDAGYEVVGVSNGAAAVKKLAEAIPDIVLLDVYMPGYSGLEVCERIKNSPVTAQVPVLLTVGKLEPFRTEEGMKVKADGVIVKPFEATDLITVVGKLAERIGAVPPPPKAATPVELPPKVQAAPLAEESDARATPIEVPKAIAAVPAFLSEADPTTSRRVAGPVPAKSSVSVERPASPQIKSEVAKPAAAATPAFDVTEPAPVYRVPASIPIVPVQPEAVAVAASQPTVASAAEPQVEFSSAPTPPAVAIPVEPELEPTILQQPIELQVDVDPTLMAGPLEAGTAVSWDSQEAPELRIETGGEGAAEFSGFDSISVEETEATGLEPQLEAAAEYDGVAGTALQASPERPAAGSADEPAAEAPIPPLEIHFETPVPAQPIAASAMEFEEQRTPVTKAHVPEPLAPTPPAPLTHASLDDHIDRALHAVLANVGTQPAARPAPDVPRSLDDIDEALGAAPQRDMQELIIEGEPETEFVMPAKEERINVSLGPDIGEAKEIIEPPAPAAPPAAQAAQSFVDVPPVTAPARPSVPSAPAAGPAAQRSRHVEFEAVSTAETTKTPQARREPKPETPAKVDQAEALKAVDNALAAVNENIAEQVVDRVLQRVRRELIDDVKRLLKET